MTYYKLLIGRIFDENSGVDRIIQICADTLVTGSLEEQPDFEFGDNPIAMNWSEKLYERHYPRKYKYCIAEMVYFNNASDITEQEIREAYKHPEIIHIPRTFLYRPHEEGSREPLKNMWWEYCRKSEWKDYTAKPPSPPLGAKEFFLRWVYLHTPPPILRSGFIFSAVTDMDL